MIKHRVKKKINGNVLELSKQFDINIQYVHDLEIRYVLYPFQYIFIYIVM